MTFRVEEDAALGLVRVTVEGVFEVPEIDAMVGQARELASAHRWNTLYDMRSARPGRMGPGDVFWMPRELPALRGAEALGVRVATLHPAELAPIADFWENSFRNMGLQARAFLDEPQALAWLAGSS